MAKPKPHYFRRLVQPTNVTVDIDICTLASSSTTALQHLEPVIKDIRANSITFNIISLLHSIPPHQLQRLKNPLFTLTQGGSGGSPRHHALAALSLLYLESIGKRTSSNGNCRYNGGVADVATSDGSTFVECGNWPARKLAEAMQQKVGFIAVPYLRKQHFGLDTANKLRTEHDAILDVYGVERPVLAYVFQTVMNPATVRVEPRVVRKTGSKPMKSYEKSLTSVLDELAADWFPQSEPDPWLDALKAAATARRR